MNVTLALVMSMVLLLAAPVYADRLGRMRAIRAGLDGFILLAVTGMVVLTLLPEAIANAEIWGLLATALAFSLPWLAERLFHAREKEMHRLLLLVASGALVLHAAADGGLLAMADHLPDGQWIEGGIVLHRFGVAMTLWWLLSSQLSKTAAAIVLMAMAAATLAGFWLGPETGRSADHGAEHMAAGVVIGIWQGIAAGSLLHVVMHPIDAEGRERQFDTATAHRVGSFLGLIFLAILVVVHGAGHGAGDVHAHAADASPAMDHAHTLDLLLAVGDRMGLVLCLILVCGALWGRLVGGLSVLNAATRIAPFTLVAWLCVALGAGLFLTVPLQSLMAGDGESDSIFGLLWVFAVAALVVRSGARAFFAPLLGWLVHDHAH